MCLETSQMCPSLPPPEGSYGTSCAPFLVWGFSVSGQALGNIWHMLVCSSFIVVSSFCFYLWIMILFRCIIIEHQPCDHHIYQQFSGYWNPVFKCSENVRGAVRSPRHPSDSDTYKPLRAILHGVLVLLPSHPQGSVGQDTHSLGLILLRLYKMKYRVAALPRWSIYITKSVYIL